MQNNFWYKMLLNPRPCTYFWNLISLFKSYSFTKKYIKLVLTAAVFSCMRHLLWISHNITRATGAKATVAIIGKTTGVISWSFCWCGISISDTDILLDPLFSPEDTGASELVDSGGRFVTVGALGLGGNGLCGGRENVRNAGCAGNPTWLSGTWWATWWESITDREEDSLGFKTLI